MRSFVQLAARFARDTNGATAIEYGIIVALLSLAIIAGVGSDFKEINNKFRLAANTIRDG